MGWYSRYGPNIPIARRVAVAGLSGFYLLTWTMDFQVCWWIQNFRSQKCPAFWIVGPTLMTHPCPATVAPRSRFMEIREIFKAFLGWEPPEVPRENPRLLGWANKKISASFGFRDSVVLQPNNPELQSKPLWLWNSATLFGDVARSSLNA